MAINYFQQLGLDSFNPGEALAQGQAYKINQFNLDAAKRQEQQMQQAQQQQALKFANDQQKQLAAQAAGMFYNSLQSGDKEGAKQIAARYQNEINSLGDPSFTVDRVNMMLETPEGLEQLKQASLGIVQLAAGPDDYATYTRGLAEASRVKPMTAYEQAQSEAKKQDLALKGQEIEIAKQRLDIDKESKKLEAMQKTAAATANDLKREELNLKIEEQKQKIADAIKAKEVAANEKSAGLESARANLDNMLNTIARVEKTNPDVIENATGPVDQFLPTLRESTADFEELVGTLGSQAFLSQIPLIKGMGQLSNAEGEKLQAALQNFSLRQSPERLKENLAEARRLLNKARANIAKQYGAQETQPDTPAANSSNAVDWGSL